MVHRQHLQREMKIRYPRCRRVSALLYSLGPRMVRGPMPSIMNSIRLCIVLREGIVSFINWEIGGRFTTSCMAWWGYLNRSVTLA